MEDKVRLLVNIYCKTYSNSTFLFQFNRIVSLNDFHKIEAFLKDCPLVKTAFLKYRPLVKTHHIRPLDANKTFSITCSNEDDALTILHGIEGCIENSFLDEITRKKANAVDTEAIKIALNSVYGKDAFNRDTDSISKELRDIVCDAKEMSRFLKEKRDEFNNLSEYWKSNEEIARRYEEFAGIANYLNRSIDKFEDLVEEICKKENNNGKID